MNARQKAKKYKRRYEELLKYKGMYESLLKRYEQINSEQHKIDTLRFRRFYPKELCTPEKSSYLREVIVKDVALSLSESLDKYMDYDVEFCPHKNMYSVYGEIKVVDRL